LLLPNKTPNFITLNSLAGNVPYGFIHEGFALFTNLYQHLQDGDFVDAGHP
jgi:hypothetical protein